MTSYPTKLNLSMLGTIRVGWAGISLQKTRQPQTRTHAIAVDVDLSVRAGSESAVLGYPGAQCGHMAIQELHKPCK